MGILILPITLYLLITLSNILNGHLLLEKAITAITMNVESKMHMYKTLQSLSSVRPL